jgi:hypothetical protein
MHVITTMDPIKSFSAGVAQLPHLLSKPIVLYSTKGLIKHRLQIVMTHVVVDKIRPKPGCDTYYKLTAVPEITQTTLSSMTLSSPKICKVSSILRVLKDFLQDIDEELYFTELKTENDDTFKIRVENIRDTNALKNALLQRYPEIDLGVISPLELEAKYLAGPPIELGCLPALQLDGDMQGTFRVSAGRHLFVPYSLIPRRFDPIFTCRNNVWEAHVYYVCSDGYVWNRYGKARLVAPLNAGLLWVDGDPVGIPLGTLFTALELSESKVQKQLLAILPEMLAKTLTARAWHNASASVMGARSTCRRLFMACMATQKTPTMAAGQTKQGPLLDLFVSATWEKNCFASRRRRLRSFLSCYAYPWGHDNDPSTRRIPMLHEEYNRR